MAIEITPDARVRVRSPYWITDEEINDFLQEKARWIEEHLWTIKKRQEEREKEPSLSPLTSQELHALADQALRVLPERARHYSELIGVTYGRITIRNQKTRWGSCSAKGNLNFNCLLMLAPEEVQDYVVIHELCHRKEMNHSKRFWAEVERVMPDYREKRRWLKEHGGELIARMMQGR